MQDDNNLLQRQLVRRFSSQNLDNNWQQKFDIQPVRDIS